MSVNFKNIGGVVREANESSCLECGFHLPIREWKLREEREVGLGLVLEKITFPVICILLQFLLFMKLFFYRSKTFR